MTISNWGANLHVFIIIVPWLGIIIIYTMQSELHLHMNRWLSDSSILVTSLLGYVTLLLMKFYIVDDTDTADDQVK